MIWKVSIVKQPSPNIVWCFPYNTKKYGPRFPSFAVLEDWLDKRYICSHSRQHNYGNTVLEIIFSNSDDLRLFVLNKT